MSIVFDILKELWDAEIRLHGLPVNMFGIPKFSPKKNSVAVTLFRLKSKGIVVKNQDGYSLTPKGKKYVKQKMQSLQNFEFKKTDKVKNDHMVLFDIPEDRKAEREWFRVHLKKLGFNMVQKSVWLGPELPKEFKNYLKSIGMQKTFKVFKLSKKFVNLD